MSLKKLVKKAKDYGFLLVENENGTFTLSNKHFEQDTHTYNTLEEVEIELIEIEGSY